MMDADRTMGILLAHLGAFGSGELKICGIHQFFLQKLHIQIDFGQNFFIVNLFSKFS